MTSDWIITLLINIEVVAEQTGNEVERAEFNFVTSVNWAIIICFYLSSFKFFSMSA